MYRDDIAQILLDWRHSRGFAKVSFYPISQLVSQVVQQVGEAGQGGTQLTSQAFQTGQLVSQAGLNGYLVIKSCPPGQLVSQTGQNGYLVIKSCPTAQLVIQTGLNGYLVIKSCPTAQLVSQTGLNGYLVIRVVLLASWLVRLV